jgi:hypothetical protein
MWATRAAGFSGLCQDRRCETNKSASPYVWLIMLGVLVGAGLMAHFYRRFSAV